MRGAKMTVITGLVCSDGIVIGADSAGLETSNGVDLYSQPTEKVVIVKPGMLAACAGSLGQGQRFVHAAQKVAKEKSFSSAPPVEVGKRIADAVNADFNESNPGQVDLQAVVAFMHKGQPQILEFYKEKHGAYFLIASEVRSGKPWHLSFGVANSATSAGAMMSLFREVCFPDDPVNVSTGIALVSISLDRAICTSTTSVGGPVQIGVIRKVRGRFVAERLDDGAQAGNIKRFRKHLARFKPSPA